MEGIHGIIGLPSGLTPSQPTNTSNLELAISGGGFFQLQGPSGSRLYTRNGSFSINSQGVVVSSSGYELYPLISMPLNRQSVSVGADGEVSVTVENSSGTMRVGNIQLATFVSPGDLEEVGGNVFRATNTSGSAETGTPGTGRFGNIIQTSSSDTKTSDVEGLVGDIVAQREEWSSTIVQKP
ncbi:Flagellar basal-body rod protein FlgG [Gracilariopsis chorda]|uniref:Flagellar basal-body rod protein FlgG n=1 Tax=Gracilariopsis chorda TaxID=448386 RepID=A0A2V3INH5_9FLOR|nr:Flagellar basal-body rod protein FlgG [Gracilariopsis chorda]|eukprot:PXF42680.1 Flagellar basal-body rod protein FlgG [Gracilariopsis chorda]